MPEGRRQVRSFVILPARHQPLITNHCLSRLFPTSYFLFPTPGIFQIPPAKGHGANVVWWDQLRPALRSRSQHGARGLRVGGAIAHHASDGCQ